MNAEKEGEFIYRVTPVFMSASGELSYGEAQEAAIVLARDTYPGKLNVTFTRGFVSSQAFVDRYVTDTDGMETLIPDLAVRAFPSEGRRSPSMDGVRGSQRKAGFDLHVAKPASPERLEDALR